MKIWTVCRFAGSLLFPLLFPLHVSFAEPLALAGAASQPEIQVPIADEKATLKQIVREIMGHLQSRPYLAPPQWKIPKEAFTLSRLQKKGLVLDEMNLCSKILPDLRGELALMGPSLFIVSASDFEYAAIQNAFDPEDVHRPSWLYVGISLTQKGKRFFVRDVLRGSPAAEAGFKVGDEVLSIGPQSSLLRADPPAAQNYTWVLKRKAASSELIRLNLPHPQIWASPHRIDDLLVRHITEATSILKNVAEESMLYLPVPATHRSRFLEALLQKLRDLKIERTSKGLVFQGKPIPIILDLRGAFGPVGPSQSALLSELGLMVEPGVPWDKERPKPTILIDRSTLGGREWLAWMLKVKAGGTLVGSTTGGMWASSEWLPLKACPGGLLVPAKDLRSPEPEGSGLEPDVLISPGLPYSAGRDPVLTYVLGQK